MYGTVAKLRARPGQVEALLAVMREEPQDMDGFVGFQVYRSDEDQDVIWMSVQFRDRASYQANADNPSQDERYRQMRAALAEDPEWHDGEVVFAAP